MALKHATNWEKVGSFTAFGETCHNPWPPTEVQRPLWPTVGLVAANPLSLLPTGPTDKDRVENTLLEVVRIDGDDYLTEIASHLIKAGGKRLRPLFTIASAAASLPDGEPVHQDLSLIHISEPTRPY